MTPDQVRTSGISRWAPWMDCLATFEAKTFLEIRAACARSFSLCLYADGVEAREEWDRTRNELDPSEFPSDFDPDSPDGIEGDSPGPGGDWNDCVPEGADSFCVRQTDGLLESMGGPASVLALFAAWKNAGGGELTLALTGRYNAEARFGNCLLLESMGHGSSLDEDVRPDSDYERPEVPNTLDCSSWPDLEEWGRADSDSNEEEDSEEGSQPTAAEDFTTVQRALPTGDTDAHEALSRLYNRIPLDPVSVDRACREIVARMNETNTGRDLLAVIQEEGIGDSPELRRWLDLQKEGN